MIKLRSEEKVAIVYGGGPDLEDGLLYLRSVENFANVKRFVIGTSPILVSNLATDLVVVEVGDEKKIGQLEPGWRKYANHIKQLAHGGSARKLFVLQTGSLNIVKNDCNYLSGVSNVVSIYSSRFYLKTIMTCMGLLIKRNFSKKDFIIHSRSSITVALDIAVVMKFKKIIILGFSPEKSGYYFDRSPSLVGRKCPLPPLSESKDIDRNPRYLRRFMNAYRFLAFCLFGTRIYIC